MEEQYVFNCLQPNLHLELIYLYMTGQEVFSGWRKCFSFQTQVSSPLRQQVLAKNYGNKSSSIFSHLQKKNKYLYGSNYANKFNVQSAERQQQAIEPGPRKRGVTHLKTVDCYSGGSFIFLLQLFLKDLRYKKFSSRVAQCSSHIDSYQRHDVHSQFRTE